MHSTSELETELGREEQTEQSMRAIRMFNRLSVANIRLKRADKLPEDSRIEMNSITDNIQSLTNSLLLGEDVKTNLTDIENRLTRFENKVGV